MSLSKLSNLFTPISNLIRKKLCNKSPPPRKKRKVCVKSTQVHDASFFMEDDEFYEDKVDEEESSSDSNDNEMRVRDGYTDKFDDGVRRTDYVLVVKEHDDTPRFDLFKKKFMIGLLKLGLHLEFHKGRMEKHKNLLFVKVHAPDQTLDQFAEPMGYKNFYRDTHLQQMGEYKTGDEVWLAPEYERCWVKLIREKYRKPLHLSSYQRGMIVHMLLKYHSFDEKGEHLGIHALLKNGIILDAYALHDGPYFFVKGQDNTEANARQILFSNWIGPTNAFRYQPKHLITEYFGRKIGFFFNFYEFYNKFLFLLALAGLATFGLHLFVPRLEEFEKQVYKKCNESSSDVVCPECSNWTLCRFQKLNYYCPSLRWASFYDDGYTVAYCITILVWAIIFYVCWRRHEMFYTWLWEQKHRPIENHIPVIRPEYVFYRTPEGRTDYEPFYWRFLRYAAGAVVSLGIMALAGYLYMLYYQYQNLWNGTRSLSSTELTKEYVITSSHKVLAVFAALAYIIMFAFEKICRLLARAMLMLENHRYQSVHECRQAVQLFSLACLACFPLPAYFGWVKGAFYIHPRNVTSEIFHINCGAYGWCLDQLVVVVIILTMLRIVLWKAMAFWIWRPPSDFGLSKTCLRMVPSWEREYRMKSVKEIDIVENYNEILLQFAIIVYLSPWFPLMPAIAFVVNWCDLKYQARIMLIHRRRPTLLPTDALLQWNTMLKGIIAVIPVVHAISITRNLRIGLEPLYFALGSYMKNWNKQFHLSHFQHYKEIEYVKNRSYSNMFTIPEKGCLFRGFFYSHTFKVHEFPTMEKIFKDTFGDAAERYEWFIKTYEVRLVYNYSLAGIILILLVVYFVPLEIPWVLNYMEVEKYLKRIYLTSPVKIPDDYILKLLERKTADAICSYPSCAKVEDDCADDCECRGKCAECEECEKCGGCDCEEEQAEDECECAMCRG